MNKKIEKDLKNTETKKVDPKKVSNFKKKRKLKKISHPEQPMFILHLITQ